MSLNIEFANQNLTIYSLWDNPEIKVYVASTPWTRRLFLNPYISGSEFQINLQNALREILLYWEHWSHNKLKKCIENNTFDVMYILRGGLNFSLHNIITDIFGYHPEVSFLSSQRIIDDKKIFLGEDYYRKWSVQDNSLLCLGDICATGTTIINTMIEAIEAYSERGMRIGHVLLFSIGTMESLAALQSWYKTKRIAHSIQSGITVVYLEGIFSLYRDMEEIFKIHLPHTDFLRRNAIASREFEIESLDDPACYLERCIIYDGGSRSFEPNLYLSQLYKYWETLKSLSGHITATKISEIYSNLARYKTMESFQTMASEYWGAIDENEIERMYLKGNRAYNYIRGKSLREICKLRLSNFNRGR